MDLMLKNATVLSKGKFSVRDVLISGGCLIAEEKASFRADIPTMDCKGKTVFPGFVDVHVHLREPGFLYKETVFTGTRAAARGGYTTVFAMPNCNPTPDSMETLALQRAAIQKDACVRVLPYGTITRGEEGKELSRMEEMAPFVCAFSDDGHGVQQTKMMREAMLRAKQLGKIIVAHCEDQMLLNGGYIHDGEYARRHGHKGISSESEWRQVERDLALVRETGCRYHVCHVSTKESVGLIRAAKAGGLPVTCETAPHYLLLDEGDLREDGRFKMNPPLRAAADRESLIEGISDGTIDMIATDHAPHSAEEKNRGLAGSLMGISGLEAAFPVLYTGLVKTGILPLEKLIALLSDNPRRVFGLEENGKAELCVFDLEKEYCLNAEAFLSKGKSTPFDGQNVFGRCVLTIAGGEIAWQEK